MEFSKSEARGTLAMIFIIIIALILTQLYKSYLKDERSTLNPAEKKELEEWVSRIQTSVAEKDPEEPVYISKSNYQPLKARPKSTAPYFKKKPLQNYEEKVEVITIIDLNTTSPAELQKVRGIGPTFSERIIKYRNLLGGFSSTDQLTEIYGLSEETITEIIKQCEIQTEPSQIDINSDSAKVLARHPYISYDLAWTIINYRKQNGDITSIEDFRKIKSVNEEVLERLRPYLQL
ncbi:MAG: helix-hairpin-helix domain-containing protein [Ekhidna sp.]|nr:helix-hairpin-helix domain-containing protein [Ekhidna sp.]MBC6426627.1 helix-hairpin-helix domain-containing protein [Ekhidna sp.]